MVSVNNTGGLGDQTNVGIKVVDVDGTSAAGSFSLANAVQAGAYQYVLRQGGNAGDINDWYLVSSIIPVPATPAIPIYRPAAVGYVAAQTANREAGFSQIGTLHQRIGEQRHAEGDHKQLWMRTTVDGDRNHGRSSFNYKQALYGIQVGADLMDRVNASGNNERAGLTLDYARSDTDFSDSKRSLANLSKETGDMKGNRFGIGAYYTHMAKDGTYLDIVGQVSKLHNRFDDVYGGKATQKGWQTNLSAEVGKPIYHTQNGWAFEPQAQLIYQHTDYDSFNDELSSMKGYNTDNVRGRIGLRVFKDDSTINTLNNYYLIANLTHDFMGTDKVNIGGTKVDERYDRSQAEIGVGAQSHISANSFFYTDARYSRSLNGNQEGGQLNLGLKWQW